MKNMKIVDGDMIEFNATLHIDPDIDFIKITDATPMEKEILIKNGIMNKNKKGRFLRLGAYIKPENRDSRSFYSGSIARPFDIGSTRAKIPYPIVPLAFITGKKEGEVFTLYTAIDVIFTKHGANLNANLQWCKINCKIEQYPYNGHSICSTIHMHYASRRNKYKIPDKFIPFVNPDKINNLIRTEKVSETFIERFSSLVDWSLVAQYQKLSERFMIKHANKLGWGNISRYQSLSTKFMEDNRFKLNWTVMSRYQKITDELIRDLDDLDFNFAYWFDWEYISQFQKLSDDFIIRFCGNLDLDLVSRYQVLSDRVLTELEYDLDWKIVTRYQDFGIRREEEDGTKNYINSARVSKYCSWLNWKHLSKKYYFSAKDIIKYASRLDLKTISKRFRLPDVVLMKYCYDVDWDYISSHYKFSGRSIRKFISFIPLKNILVYQNVSNKFLNEIIDSIGNDKDVINTLMERIIEEKKE